MTNSNLTISQKVLVNPEPFDAGNFIHCMMQVTIRYYNNLKPMWQARSAGLSKHVVLVQVSLILMASLGEK